MDRATVKQTLVILTVLLIGGGALTACGGSGEELSIVRAFFQASRFNDRATLGNMTMVFFDPVEEGIASSPSVDNVSEEQRRPLRVRELQSALEQTQAEETAFREEKLAYQNENEEAIGRVIEAEREDEDVASRDQEVQEMWTDWVSQEQDHARLVSGATAAINEESILANASVYDPSNPINVAVYEGELVRKDVTVTAEITKDGESADRTMVFTLQKVELQGEEDRLIEGRWIITAIE